MEQQNTDVLYYKFVSTPLKKRSFLWKRISLIYEIPRETRGKRFSMFCSSKLGEIREIILAWTNFSLS